MAVGSSSFARDVKILRRRVLQAVPVVFGIICINFLMLQLIPGDIVDVITAGTDGASPEYVERLRREFGLDQPVYVQLLTYVWNVLRLDLGFSATYNQSVSSLIGEALWPTVLLMGSSTVLSAILGVALGVYASRHVHTLRDNVVSVLTMLAYATPSFWLGLMLIVVFAVKLGLLPVAGMATIGGPTAVLPRAWDVFQHLLMPMVSLSLIFVAIYARLMRTSMLEVFGLDFVRTARAKGISDNRVTYHHVLRNALLPVVTFLGVQTGSLLGGAVVIESVFAWPGLGRLAHQAVLQRDYNLLLGILLCGSLLVVAMNLVIDLVYARLDPRVELK